MMPIAITDAAKIISGGMVQMNNLFYGASLLITYGSHEFLKESQIT